MESQGPCPRKMEAPAGEKLPTPELLDQWHRSQAGDRDHRRHRLRAPDQSSTLINGGSQFGPWLAEVGLSPRCTAVDEPPDHQDAIRRAATTILCPEKPQELALASKLGQGSPRTGATEPLGLRPSQRAGMVIAPGSPACVHQENGPLYKDFHGAADYTGPGHAC